MLKFEQELADNLGMIYKLGNKIISMLSAEPDKQEDYGDKILELYRERKPYFDNVSSILANNKEASHAIKNNLDSWQEKIKPLIKQDELLQSLLAERLEKTKHKLKLSTQGKSLLVYSKGK